MQCTTSQWLSLVRAPGIGARRLSPLIQQSSGIDDLLRQTSGKLSESLRQALEKPDEALLENDLRWLEQPGNLLIPLGDPLYPELLAQIDDPPVALFANGDAQLLCMPQIAIVGSRNPTRQGGENAFAFARHLAEAGLTITSGMALGIDTQAHRGSLSTHGKTIAVIGTGTDRVYPASNHQLAHEIRNNGLIVSEFPPGTEAKAGHFPQRNRMISGLSLGTLVVEATIKSGSLITARQAIEQGREIFAIPGSIHNPQSKGCHRLIRDGAKLVETSNDIIEELSSLLSTLELPGDLQEQSSSISAAEIDEDYRQLLEIIGWDPVPTEKIIKLSGLTPEAVSSMLLLLELQGHVSSAPGGCYCRAKPMH